MKKSYRLAQEATYAAALKAVKVSVKKVTAHKDGSATIAANEKVAAAVKRIEGVQVLAEGKGELTFSIPAAMEYHAANPPLWTEEQKAAMAAEAAQRKAERAAKRADAAALDEEDVSEEADDSDAPEVPENGI